MSVCDGLDWGSVGYPGNPVPGDSGGTDALAGKLRSASVAFSGMSDSLRCLSGSNGLKGRYADQLRAKTDGFAPDFAKLAASLSAASGEMGGWSSEMDSHQRAARAAYDQIVAAQQAASNWADSMRSLPSRVDNTAMDMKAYAPGAPGADPDKYAQAKKAHDAARKRLDELTHQQAVSQADADAAKRALDRVVAAYNADADKHRRKIDTAYNDLPTLNLLENILYSDEWEATVQAAKIAGDALVVLSFFVPGGWLIDLGTALVYSILLANDISEGIAGDRSGADLAFSIVIDGGFAISGGLGFFSKMASVGGAKGLASTDAFVNSTLLEDIEKSASAHGSNIISALKAENNGVIGRDIAKAIVRDDAGAFAKDTAKSIAKTWAKDVVDRMTPAGPVKLYKQVIRNAMYADTAGSFVLTLGKSVIETKAVPKIASRIQGDLEQPTATVNVDYVARKLVPMYGAMRDLTDDIEAL